LNSPKTKKKPKLAKAPDIEIEPGAWERFEKLVKSAAKMGHQAHARSKPRAQRKKTTG
jgi:hypothetical protein